MDINAELPTVEESTAGVDTALWKPEGTNTNISIWDFAGHTITHTVHRFFLSQRCLYILVHNGRVHDGHAESEQQVNQLKYWLDHVKNYGGESRAIILVNETDPHKVEIPVRSLSDYYHIGGSYSLNIKTDRGKLQHFRQFIIESIVEEPLWKNQQIPKEYYAVKEDLQKIFNPEEEKKGEEHISKETFYEITKKHNVAHPEQLLKDLDALGISLWYKGMDQFNTLVLNPEWISKGIYSIINWTHKQEKHALCLNDFIKVFAETLDRYPKEKHPFLYALLKKYKLAYETEGQDDLVIPSLLKVDRPKELPLFEKTESLLMVYESQQSLPPDVIPRFIVQHHKEILHKDGDGLVWRYGVVLEDKKGSLAMVRKIDQKITVDVKGKNKTTFISRLRETLTVIFDSYKSEKPALRYRIIDLESEARKDSLPDEQEIPLLPEKTIKNLLMGERPYVNNDTGQNIPIEPTGNIYNIHINKIEITGTLEGSFIGSIHKETIFNFHNCNITLQRNLNELLEALPEESLKEEKNKLSNVVQHLDKLGQKPDKDLVKKQDVFNTLRRTIEEIEDESSPLHKTVKAVKHGINIAQDIAEKYNAIAQWTGLPVVPKPFLKKKKD